MARTEFSGFTDDELRTIATRMGYDESQPLSNFNRFLSSSPAKARQFLKVQNKAVKKFAKGGLVKMAVGGTPNVDPAPEPIAVGGTPNVDPAPEPIQAPPLAGEYGQGFNDPEMSGVYNLNAGRVTSPGDFMPEDTRLSATMIGDNTTGTQVGTDATTGQVDTTAPVATQTLGELTEANAPVNNAANTMTAATTTPGIDNTLSNNQAAQGTVGENSLLTAQTQDPATTAIANQNAAQINQATQVVAPNARTLQDGELIAGSAVNQDSVDTLATQTQQSAATADPSTQATVKGQLDTLMQDFDDGQTPTWAAGAMRAVREQLGARGLGASSLAGQAVIQAAMESAIPIASADARTIAQFETQNLSNRQQTAMLAAQQRASFLQLDFNQEFQSRVANASKVSDIANMNFSAEQQIALENARMAQTVDLANLNNRQAMVMAQTAQMANIETTNLNNRQQSAVQNAQAFLNMDMTNLNNSQQTAQINNQARIQSMFTDQAAENAARQFNASSQTQADQFFESLSASVSQFNATQSNSMSQYNAGQGNALSQFNSNLKNQREQFNAQNRLVIDQSNAQWRRQIATADTAAVNFANQFNAEALLDASTTAYNDLWQYNRDLLEWAWTSSENDKSRMTEMAISEINAKTRTELADMAQDGANSEAIGGFVFDLVKPGLMDFVGGIF